MMQQEGEESDFADDEEKQRVTRHPKKDATTVRQHNKCAWVEGAARAPRALPDVVLWGRGTGMRSKGG
jgi:hypothetical protein